MEKKLIKEIKKISVNPKHQFNFLAKFIINNLSVIPYLNIQQLAKQVFSSVPTIKGFIKSLDLNDYQSFIELISYYNNNYDLIFTGANIIFLSESNAAQTNFKATISIISKTYKLIIAQKKIINNVVTTLLTAKKIYLFALGSSYNVVKDFSDKLLKIGFPVLIANDFHSFYFLVNQANKNDVVMMVSYSGESVDLIKIAKICEYKKIKVISITKNCMNTLLNYSSHYVLVANDTSTHIELSITQRLALLFMLNILYLNIYNSNYEEYRELMFNRLITKL